MARFFISDNHWSHSNIIKYTNRDFKDVHEMNREMTNRWNSVVGINDDVYHLGDFSFGNPGLFASKLNGKIHLCLGNHDKLSQVRGHFFEIFENGKTELEIYGHKVLLNHFYYKQMQDTNFDNKFKDRLPDYYPGQILLHGHCHNSKPMINKEYKAINCSVEWHDYTPISEAKIIQMIQENF